MLNLNVNYLPMIKNPKADEIFFIELDQNSYHMGEIQINIPIQLFLHIDLFANHFNTRTREWGLSVAFQISKGLIYVVLCH